MKKKVVSIFLATAMAMTMIAGCGNDAGSDDGGANVSDDGGASTADDGASDDGASAADDGASADAIANLIAATDGTVTLQLWCSETDAYQGVMASLVEDFKNTYSDVDFDISIGAVSEADAKDRVLEDVEAAADVFVFADDQLLELINAGALQNVATTYTYDVSAANTPSIIEAASYNGTLYAYPLTASNGFFLFYNSEVLTADDVSTWENLVAAAEAAGKKVGMDIGNGWYNYGFFAGAGLYMTMNDDQSNSCNWNATDTTPTGVEVAEAIQNICASSAFLAVGDADAQAMAPDGDLVAYVSGTWDASVFEAAYGDGYAATKLPTFNAGGTDYQMRSFAGYKFVGVNAFSDYTGWAMLLAEYLTSEASQLKIGEATGEGPANINASASISSPALSALGEQSAYADLQRVGGAYWDPAASLGASLAEGSAGDLQTLLDTAVDGITQPVAAE